MTYIFAFQNVFQNARYMTSNKGLNVDENIEFLFDKIFILI